MSYRRHLRLRLENDPKNGGRKKLKLVGKDLSGGLPYDLFDLSELEILELSPERQSCLLYRLEKLPKEIGRLVNLKVLMLDTNELRELPAELSNLRHLERLALSNNRLKTLPHDFSDLQSLQSLHLVNNQFEEFPLEVCYLESLTFLDVSDNKLTALPKEVSYMGRLETFLLFFNEIRSLPDNICKMKSLKTLWLGKNKLTALPKHFGRLKQLDWGYRQHSSNIDGNPLRKPPLEICRRGPLDIARYFAMKEGWKDGDPDSDYDENQGRDPEDLEDERKVVRHTHNGQI
ncbi:malignant fibrous histiocytoma-amplified sequence 1-like [Branchiostoma lanceolatum]|uniref:malignant fibrous histiocytoma-amplified sequence 1-like n=1 Tax=Branchiostoma lanceolatum TaxID=7740 RepID=UPI0034542697